MLELVSKFSINIGIYLRITVIQRFDTLKVKKNESKIQRF